MTALLAVLPAISFVLKDGASHARFTWIGGAFTVISLAVFIAWVWWALNPARRQQLDQAALLPFDDTDGGVQ